VRWDSVNNSAMPSPSTYEPPPPLSHLRFSSKNPPPPWNPLTLYFPLSSTRAQQRTLHLLISRDHNLPEYIHPPALPLAQLPSRVAKRKQLDTLQLGPETFEHQTFAGVGEGEADAIRVYEEHAGVNLTKFVEISQCKRRQRHSGFMP